MTKEEFISLGLTEEQAEKAAVASAKELETAKGSITDLTGKLKDFDGVDEVKVLKVSTTGLGDYSRSTRYI